ncbi:MAG: hypothetical protein HZA14_11785 [Nitrospirae bacterium]|nr:hypothetical protein [Nitrospirota bacterium]
MRCINRQCSALSVVTHGTSEFFNLVMFEVIARMGFKRLRLITESRLVSPPVAGDTSIGFPKLLKIDLLNFILLILPPRTIVFRIKRPEYDCQKCQTKSSVYD